MHVNAHLKMYNKLSQQAKQECLACNKRIYLDCNEK